MKCTKTRGKKGVPHRDPDDPPRRRANKARGHGTWDSDRPPIQGVIGRESGQVRLTVMKNSRRVDIEPLVLSATKPGSTVNTDEWRAYGRIAESDRVHSTVCHSPGKRVWAFDEDGDGVREVHNNTMEGFWTGLRNFLRPFRGVTKKYLHQYLAVHELAHNLKTASNEFLRAICGVTQIAT
jgi:transposase-like protein